ncbi:Vacuolar protein sorting-associated protein 41 [Allomyces arbusculus]|nr:Vacuolar protein sorting-associated protein 41 [Allomyces arbusculus]
MSNPPSRPAQRRYSAQASANGPAKLTRPRSPSAPPDPVTSESETIGDDDHDDHSSAGSSDADGSEGPEPAEPSLKYTRLTGDLPSLLASDAVSAAACNDKFLALGTHWGHVYVVDFSGNLIKQFSNHSTSVAEVCIDANAEFIASAGGDGRVVVRSMFSDEDQCYEFQRPLKCLQLDPDFARTRRFATGGHAGEVVLSDRTWRGPRKVILASVDGIVLAVSWRGNLIAYATEHGIGVYDVKAARDICQAQVPFHDDRPDLFRCHMVWRDDENLVIGWQRAVLVLQIRPPSMFETAYQAQILVQTTVDFVVGGILPYGDQYLTYGITQRTHSDGSTSNPPECILLNLRIMDPVVSRDSINLAHHEHLQPIDYSVVGLPAEQAYFLISPRDVISVRARDANDQIEWRLQHLHYEDALQVSLLAAQQGIAIRPEYRAVHVGQQLLTDLLEHDELERAAGLCPMVLGKDPELWERWIYVFADRDGLDAILPCIPTQNPVLNHTVYEVILAHYLSANFKGFRNLIEKWPRQLYNTASLLGALEDTLLDFPNDEDLVQAAVVLYRIEGNPVKEIQCLMALRDVPACMRVLDATPFVLTPLMRQSGARWLDLCFDEVGRDLVKFVASECIARLVQQSAVLPPGEVVELLEDRSDFQYAYLLALFKDDAHSAPDLQEHLLELLVEFRSKELLDFLKRSIYYPLDKALALCESHDLLQEQVYVLGRIGNNKRALEIMMDRMDDIHMAIDYAKGQQDEELWNDLVDFAVQKPKYWAPLFQHTGMFLDPIKLIKRVPPGAQISNLKSLLTSIVQDALAQVELRGQSHQVLREDVLTFMRQSMRYAKSSRYVTSDTCCVRCGQPFAANPQLPVTLDELGAHHAPSCPET